MELGTLPQEMRQIFGCTFRWTLGFQLSYLNGVRKHTQAFMSLRKFFYSPHLTRRIRVICYLPRDTTILTCRCPIPFNLSTSQMKKLKSFREEMFGASNYEHYVTNEVMYVADISQMTLYDSYRIGRTFRFRNLRAVLILSSVFKIFVVCLFEFFIFKINMITLLLCSWPSREPQDGSLNAVLFRTEESAQK